MIAKPVRTGRGDEQRLGGADDGRSFLGDEDAPRSGRRRSGRRSGGSGRRQQCRQRRSRTYPFMKKNVNIRITASNNQTASVYRFEHQVTKISCSLLPAAPAILPTGRARRTTLALGVPPLFCWWAARCARNCCSAFSFISSIVSVDWAVFEAP